MGFGAAPCTGRAGSQRHRHACARSALGRGFRRPRRADGARRRIVGLTATVAGGSRAVEVNVTVRDSQASIHFGAAQAETRALSKRRFPGCAKCWPRRASISLDASVSQGFARQARPDAPAASRRAPNPTARCARPLASRHQRTARPLRVMGTSSFRARWPRHRHRCRNQECPHFRRQKTGARRPGFRDAAHTRGHGTCVAQPTPVERVDGRRMSAWHRS